MNRDDIIRMAQEAGLSHGTAVLPHNVEVFAALVAAAEREECAKACVEPIVTLMDPRNNRTTVGANLFSRQKTSYECATAIRARGKQ